MPNKIYPYTHNIKWKYHVVRIALLSILAIYSIHDIAKWKVQSLFFALLFSTILCMNVLNILGQLLIKKAIILKENEIKIPSPITFRNKVSTILFQNIKNVYMEKAGISYFLVIEHKEGKSLIPTSALSKEDITELYTLVNGKINEITKLFD